MSARLKTYIVVGLLLVITVLIAGFYREIIMNAGTVDHPQISLPAPLPDQQDTPVPGNMPDSGSLSRPIPLPNLSTAIAGVAPSPSGQAPLLGNTLPYSSPTLLFTEQVEMEDAYENQ